MNPLLPNTLLEKFSAKSRKNNDDKYHHIWKLPSGSSLHFALTEIQKQHNGAILYIGDDTRQMGLAEREQKFYLPKAPNEGADLEANKVKILNFPDWETLPYDYFSPHKSLIAQRLNTLSALSNYQENTPLIINCHVNSLIQKLPPLDYVQGYTFSFKKNQQLNVSDFRRQLQQANYLHVTQVMSESEFSIRGGIIDVFPMGEPYPFRIDLFDDIIEEIRYFDPQNQQSIDHVDAIELLPGNEFPYNDESIQLFKRHYRENFDGDLREHTIYNEIKHDILPAGIEFYLPLFFENVSTIFDYLPENTLIVYSDRVFEIAQTAIAHAQDRYENAKLDKNRPPLPVEHLYQNPQMFYDKLRHYQSIELIQDIEALPEKKRPQLTDLKTNKHLNIEVNHQLANPHEQFIDYLQNSSFESKRTLIVCETLGRKESLLSILASHQIHPQEVNSWQGFIHSDCRLAITYSEIERGFILDVSDDSEEQNSIIEVIAEPELYQDRVYLSSRSDNRRARFSSHDPEAIIRSLDELKVDDPVVHIDHGVGRYRGLQIIEAGGIKSEYLLLEYANESKLYVPILSIHLINRYTGGDPEKAPIHILGTDTWSEQKRKAKQKAYDVATELLETLALRKLKSGITYKVPKNDYISFCDGFPYEETKDQKDAIEAILGDMSSSKPMDRLICGDVGFGKTEVAMRAAYISAYNKKQVAVLVPTTLLAQQHYESFINRFANHAINIDKVSRLKTPAQINQTLEDFESGKIDILIGTHRLLQKDFKTSDLGLVIIDEEHRFGVRQKEQLKKITANVDLLTLTATPIPRTLNQAMNKLRDISLITTPPKDRIAVKTFVREKNNAIISEAINRELHRGGQVYFLHNDVKTIEKTAAELQELIPHASIGIGHGQLSKKDLEETMQNFYHQRYNIFVCSTIVENGIDNPYANTILINKANNFGLAQLHQLRGRVGRSHHQAYAYMLVDEMKLLSDDAKKRLDAIAGLDELGAGFMLASHDLEIRGAGEILGEAQSGAIDTVGLSLYTQYIHQAIRTLKAQSTKNAIDSPLDDVNLDDLDIMQLHCDINFNFPALIPDDYIEDVHTRLVFYKRISSRVSVKELHEIKIELIDRFGLMPDELKYLFDISELKLQAQKLGLSQITMSDSGGTVTFNEKTTVKPEQIIFLVQQNYKKYKLVNQTQLRIIDSSESFIERLRIVERLFAELA